MQAARSCRGLAVIFAVALAACGGGGGGGGGGSDLQISVDRSSLLFVTAGPGGASQTVHFTVTSGTGTYYAFVVLDRPSTFNATVNFTSQTAATATITTTTPPLGTTTGAIRFRLCPDAGCSSVAWERSIPYSIEAFAVPSAALAFQATEGLVAPEQVVTVTPADPGSRLAATVVGTTPWLSVVRSDASHFRVTASAAGLRAGSRSGQVRISAVGGGSSTTIPVTLAVSPAVAPPADTTVTLDLAGSLTGSIPVVFRDGASAAWTATSSRPWLTLPTASGTGTGAVQYAIDPAALGSVANWANDVATVVVDPAGLSTVATRLTLQKRLPELYLVSPAAVPAGTPAAVHVFGRGLSQLASAGAVTVSGASAAVTGIPAPLDAEAVVTVTVAAAGRATVSVPNPFGIPTRAVELAVDPVTAWSAVKVAYAGEIQSAQYDPVRRAVYALNTTQRAVVRYQLDLDAWTVTSTAPVAEIRALGLSADRQTLFVSAGDALYCDGFLHAFDPDTLQTATGGVPLPTTYCLTGASRSGLQVTNNGRLWFPGTQWSDLTYFDLLGRRFQRLGTSVLRSVRHYASPDGSRMVIGQGDGNAAGFYTTSADTVAAPGVGAVYYGAAASRDGRIYLVDEERVYDTSTDPWTLGTIAIAANSGYVLAQQVSPDGSKAYLAVSSGPTASWTLSRVDVFDTTTLLKVGEIPVTLSAAACASNAPSSCSFTPSFLMGPRGDVLFLVGNQGLVVLPIPPELAGPP